MAGAGATEEVLSAKPGRVLVRADRGGGKPLIIRRIDATAADGHDLIARSAALRLIEGRRLPAIAPVQRVRLHGPILTITETWIDGFALSVEAAQDAVTVNVALSIAHDVAKGLAELHRTVEPDRRPAGLIHGRVALDTIMIDQQGHVRLVGNEGQRGSPATDATGLMEALRNLLDRRTSTLEGRILLERLRALSFASTDAVRDAIEGYLRRQDPERLRAQRHAFNVAVRERLGMSPAVAEEQGAGFGAPLATPMSPAADAQNTAPYGGWDVPVYDADGRPVDATPGWSPWIGDSDVSTMLAAYGSVDDDLTVDAKLDLRAVEAPVRTEPSAAPLGPAAVGGSLAAQGEALSTSAVDGPAPRGTADVGSYGVDGPAPRGTADVGSYDVDGPAPPGTVDVGPYRVVASIGRGGMGEIYLARRRGAPRSARLIALKILSSTVQDPDFDDAVAMLMDEAAIMARIDHPHVLKVIDFGRALDRYYLATEYLEGRPLVRVMVEAYALEKGLDYGVIATLGADAALGLYAAHTASTPDGTPLKVIHRDVSPQNIFVSYDGVTKVIDFGVARASERVSRTEVGLVKGKTAYMSPEQAKGIELDGRSDVFGLGVCLWEMTAGRRLFKRDREYETLLAVQSDTIEPPTQVRGEPNPILDHIILSALHRDRNQRTPSAHALATQLMDFAEHALGPDRRRHVRDLLHRLFGDVAEKERALIGRLEADAATGEEARELEMLSGVSARGQVRQITLVGRPAGLNELEGFGSTAPRGTAPSTSEHVIRMVTEARIDLGLVVPPGQQVDDRPPDGDVESPWTRPNNPLATAGPDDDETVPLPKEWRERGFIDGLDPESERLESDGFVVVGPQREDQTPVVEVARPRRTRTLPTWVLLTLGLLFLAAGAWIGLHFDGDPKQLWRPEVWLKAFGFDPAASESPEPPQGPEAAAPLPMPDIVDPAATEPAGPAQVAASPAAVKPVAAEPARAEATRGSRAADPASATRAAADPALATRTAAKVAKPAAATRIVVPSPGRSADPVVRPEVKAPPLGRTDLRSFASAVRKRGLSVAESRGTLVIDDGRGGSITVDPEARVGQVEAPSVTGWVVQTHASSLPAVAWVGSANGSPMFARSLSVNDCRATLRVGTGDIGLRYGRDEVRLPLGGGVLVDVALERPAFADRLELEPLGLSFGAEDRARPQRHCGTGWWGRQVVLRRLPPGRYALRWSGSAMSQTATMEVSSDAVVGGQVIRSVQVP